jgi:catechol 2,3-dioxygenase-like lactoylglutathione lyase family enzyme
MWHPGLKEVRERTQTRPGYHRCELCGDETHYKLMRFDHIDPAVHPSDGFVDWRTYAGRLLDAVPEGIQHVCQTCHTAKTAHERVARNKKPQGQATWPETP